MASVAAQSKLGIGQCRTSLRIDAGGCALPLASPCVAKVFVRKGVGPQTNVDRGLLVLPAPQESR
jgi:hypothetical protein